MKIQKLQESNTLSIWSFVYLHLHKKLNLSFSYEIVTRDRCDTCFYKIPTRAGRKALYLFIYIILLYILLYKSKYHKCHLSQSNQLKSQVP